MVTISLKNFEVLHIMEAFIAQEDIKHFPRLTKAKDMQILIKLYKGLTGKDKTFGKEWVRAYFDEAEMKYSSYMPTFLKVK